MESFSIGRKTVYLRYPIFDLGVTSVKFVDSCLIQQIKLHALKVKFPIFTGSSWKILGKYSYNIFEA